MRMWRKKLIVQENFYNLDMTYFFRQSELMNVMQNDDMPYSYRRTLFVRGRYSVQVILSMKLSPFTFK